MLSLWHQGLEQRGTLQTFPRVQQLQYSGLVLLVLRSVKLNYFSRLIKEFILH